MQSFIYPNHLKLNEALPLYFAKYHFENGGYDLKYFKIKIGQLYLPFPNTKDRIAAVKIHDIHHILTEYPANLKGEAEIGAWELASGCGPYYMARLLNSASFFYGLFCFPRALFKAFMRARKCNSNCYHGIPYDQVLLNKTVGELRTLIALDQSKKNTIVDYLYFIFWCILTLSPFILAAVFIC